MLALPGRISKRAVGDPELPVRIIGILSQLELGRGCVVLTFGEYEQAVDVTGIPPSKYHLGKPYEFLGMATGTVVLAFWGRLVPEDVLDISLEEIAQTLDVIEASVLFRDKRTNKNVNSN